MTDRSDISILSPVLSRLTDIILDWNERINVTAITQREDFYNKNVLDSLELVGHPEIEGAHRVLDLGTGGGFPGLPLAIAYPDKEFVLVDSVAKKLKVVKAAADELGLTNVSVVHSRAEDLARDPEFRERFDLVVSRAVANMSTLSEYCLPFVRKGGTFVAYKTLGASEEIEAARGAVKKLGGELVSVDPYSDESVGHCFVKVRKTSATPSAYPRKGGLPRKAPL